MKYSLALTFFLIFSSNPVLANDVLYHEDPEPRVPKRADAEGEVREVLDGTNLKKGDLTNKREVRQNQEETDPIFYDSTTSPAEMNNN